MRITFLTPLMLYLIYLVLNSRKLILTYSWTLILSVPGIYFYRKLHEAPYLILAILALLTAGLSCSVWQAAAGGGGLPVSVTKPGKGHTGRDGGH